MTVTHCIDFSTATKTRVTGSENLVGEKVLGAISNIMVRAARARHDIAGEGRRMESVSCSDDNPSLCSWINK